MRGEDRGGPMPVHHFTTEEVPTTTFGGSPETAAGLIGNVISRHRYLFLAFFSALYLGTTCYRASRKLFWFDEISTIYISRLPDARSVWTALTHGADLNPPLIYGLTHYSEILLGQGELPARLPEILGFWIFCVCLFRFVSLRASVLGGFISMLFPLVTGAYYYAYEARPHGLVLGFCGLALLSWQAAANQQVRRTCWILGLGGSLALAMLSHTYAVLLLAPVMAGEMARSFRTRRLDWPILLSIAAGSACILVSLPLFRNFQSAGGA